MTAVVEQRDRSLLTRVQHVLHAQATIGPAVVLLTSVIVFALLSERFLTPGNISLILQQVAVVGTLAVGQTIVILTAGIDLSCGAIMVLTSIVMAKVASETGLPGLPALLLGFLVGTVCGLLNGMLVTRLKLPPFIVTLGTLNVFFALNLWYSGSATIRGSDMPSLLLWTGQTFTVGGTRITYGSILLVVLVAAMAFVLKNTAWGRHVYSTGDDLEASRLSGIRTARVLLSVYATAGLIYAVAAWTLIGRIASASPQAGQTDNLDSITAVVIGGTSLFGGRGAVVGSLIGALIVGVFRNGLALAGVDVLWQTMAVGVLIIVAVSLDQWIRKVKA
ncbi:MULTISPECIES: ABC transporter permease [Lentzea]|uniref:Fructose transport system permease protein n=1 Tax=Lentzea flaviverrucosa TaxID=200379 RepID=A0A1H9B0W3_9PSEU|nr:MULTISPECIES: ABC transporter permease [Lentzea]MCR3752300.1 fructose transport system permease protein [Lentzea californiensis]RDI31912.1 mannose ABC transporter membrane protein /fructose ABC transporter membrane protein /ribose ABC transporter membrane protein [Lentzea flaviverrucosa]SEP82676.1 fructose transport system permease protein [Lentzea flaviverrucosa]